MMLAGLANCGIWFVLGVPHVEIPIEGHGLAPLARADLSEHDVCNSQLLVFIFNIRVVVLLIYDETSPEDIVIGINLGDHFLIMHIFVIHVHSQSIHRLFVDNMDGCICHKSTSSVSFELLWKIVAAQA